MLAIPLMAFTPMRMSQMDACSQEELPPPVFGFQAEVYREGLGVGRSFVEPDFLQPYRKIGIGRIVVVFGGEL